MALFLVVAQQLYNFGELKNLTCLGVDKTNFNPRFNKLVNSLGASKANYRCIDFYNLQFKSDK